MKKSFMTLMNVAKSRLLHDKSRDANLSVQMDHWDDLSPYF